MSRFDEADVVAVMEPRTPMTKGEILAALGIQPAYCSECGAVENTEELAAARERLDAILRSLICSARVGTTPDWEYKLVGDDAGA